MCVRTASSSRHEAISDTSDLIVLVKSLSLARKSVYFPRLPIWQGDEARFYVSKQCDEEEEQEGRTVLGAASQTRH